MTSLAPLYSWTDTVIAADDYVRVGGVGLRLDGTAAFSLAGWVQPLSEGVDVGFLTALDSDGNPALQLMFNDAVDGVVVEVQWPQNGWLGTQMAILIGTWHFLAVTYNPTGSTLSIYLDGALALQESVSAPARSAGSTFVFANGYARTNSFTFWTTCLTGAQLLPTWGPPAAGTAGVDTSVDFSQVPPVDVSGNGRTVGVGDTTSAACTAPGLALTGTGCLAPSPDDGLNPGTASQPFSVQLWANPTGQVTPLNAAAGQALVANGDISGAAGLSIYLQVDSTQTQWVLAARLGGSAATPIVTNSAVDPNEWHNYAVTYDGATLTVYLDGAAVGSGQPASPTQVISPTVAIGAAPDSTWPGGYSHQFTGYLQAVSIWSRALSASDVVTGMSGEPDPDDPACVGYFACTVSDTSNRVSSKQSALVDIADTGLQISEVPLRATPSSEPAASPTTTAQSTAAVTAPERSELDAWLDRLRANAPGAPPTDGPVSADDVQAMIDDYTQLVERTIPASLRQHYTDLFRSNLHAGLSAVAHDQILPGTVTYTKDGNDTVFVLHTHTGPLEVYRAADVDPCIAWLASVIATAVSLIFIVLGLGYAISKLAGYFRTLFTGNALARLTAFSDIRDATVSAWTVIMIVRTMTGITGLVPIVTNGLAGVSWWSWAWTIAGAVAQIASIWLTGGWYLAYVIAQIALWLGQLITVINSKPGNCFSSTAERPRLGPATI